MAGASSLKHPMVGTRVIIQGQYHEPDAASTFGALIDPDEIEFQILKPDGTVTQYFPPQITRISEGVYQLEIEVDQDGQWIVQCEGDSFDATYAVTDEKTFFVRPSRI